MKKYLFASIAVLGLCGTVNAGDVGTVKTRDGEPDKKIAGAIITAANAAAQPTYPIASAVATSRRTVIPVPVPKTSPLLAPNDVAGFAKYGYGVWQEGPKLAIVKSTDIMPSGYNDESVIPVANLLHFFTMSDVHITDVQCPAQLLVSGLTRNGNSSAYSPVIPYTTQVLDAAVQTVNYFNANDRKFDFGIFLGDAANNAQYNELRWYIDTIDGRVIKPNSDPAAKESSKTPLYMRQFQTAGLDKTIPWYQVMGNHDHFYLGTWVESPKTSNAAVGKNIIDVGLNPSNPLAGTGNYGGVVNSTTAFAEVIYAGPKGNFRTQPKVNANPVRRALAKAEWIAEFFKTSPGSLPPGHGFDKSKLLSACYTFEPKAGLLKVIALDDTETDNMPSAMGAASGFIDEERYKWLVDELDKGQAENKLMIIAAHIPIGQTGLWADPTSRPSESGLIAKLHTYPNLLMWISGHLHRNTVTPMPSPDKARPELGFWVVETASLRDFPQEFRIFDVVRNSDNTVSIIAIDVDPSVRRTQPAEISRSYGIAADEIFPAPKYPPVNTPSHAYNAQLFKQLSPEMQLKIQNYAAPGASFQ